MKINLEVEDEENHPRGFRSEPDILATAGDPWHWSGSRPHLPRFSEHHNKQASGYLSLQLLTSVDKYQHIVVYILRRVRSLGFDNKQGLFEQTWLAFAINAKVS